MYTFIHNHDASSIQEPIWKVLLYDDDEAAHLIASDSCVSWRCSLFFVREHHIFNQRANTTPQIVSFFCNSCHRLNILVHTIFVQKATVHPFSDFLQPTLTNATRCHEYSRKLSGFLSMAVVLVSLFTLRFEGKMWLLVLGGSHRLFQKPSQS